MARGPAAAAALAVCAALAVLASHKDVWRAGMLLPYYYAAPFFPVFSFCPPVTRSRLVVYQWTSVHFHVCLCLSVHSFFSLSSLSALYPSPTLFFSFLSSLSCLRAAVLGQVVEVDSHEPVTLHKSTAAQEHRLLGKLHSLEGTINTVTGLVRGGRGRVFRVAKGQNLDLVPIEVNIRFVRCEPRVRAACANRAFARE